MTTEPEFPWIVGEVETNSVLDRFRTHDEAAEYISTLPDHETGIYYIDGPTAESQEEEVTLTFTVEITHCPDPDEPSPTEDQIADALYLAGVVNRGEATVIVTRT